MKLDGKVALITGGTSGIGEACADLFAAEGAKVALVGSSDLGKAKAVAARIEATGGSAKPYVANLSIVDEIAKLVAAVKADFGRVDILVNSAGVFYPTPVGGTSEADYDRMMGINLKGLFFCVNEVAPLMIAQGSGCIVNLSSVAGVMALGTYSAYCAAKAGLHGLTRAIAIDHGKDGIRCNAVAPGWIDTQLNEEFIESMEDAAAFRLDIGKIHPAGRTGSPAEIAALVAFLASEEAAFITGEIYRIDGGRMAKLSLPG